MDALLVKIGVEMSQPGALFMAASLLAGVTDYSGDRELLKIDVNGFPSVSRNLLTKMLDSTLFNDDVEDLRSVLLNSCDFPPEVQYDELY